MGQTMEQMIACLLVEIRTNREWMEAKMDDGQVEMEAQVGSLASRIDVNQEDMKAILDACLEKMEANPEELRSAAVLQEVAE
jgi:hypothetical protein